MIISSKQGKRLLPLYFYNKNILLLSGWFIDEFLSSSSVITKVITVVETVVDGKVVESSKTVDVDVDDVE